ncbi:MAG: 16S rRNA (cytosine(967)-C(5))-methyltransferase RsmB [Clostridia bacterium]|nr:16S rRNA (cytosine(967)-C(5))-methyltransferase RsmB [Clostridia bacterium]
MIRRPDFRRSAPCGRDLAIEVAYRCDQDGMFAHAAWSLSLCGKVMDPRERRLGMEIAFGAIRRRVTLDWCIESSAARLVSQIDPLALAILRTGAYQIMFMSRIPKHSAVSEAVESARRLTHSGIASFANAVLRRIASPSFEPGFPDPACGQARAMAVRLSYPEWLVRLWIENYGPENAEEMLRAGNDAPSVVLRANTARGTVDAVSDSLKKAGVSATPGQLVPEALRVEGPIDSVESLPGFDQGQFSVQDESSMLVAHVLAAKPGDFVIDACAAPGGKATHIAELARDSGRVLAADVAPDRVEMIRQSSERLGLSSVEPICCDARVLAESYSGQADAVLVDAPCSGLGVLARRPDARFRKSPEEIAVLADLQAQILSSAAACVKSGGTLVYSTCTLTRAENQEQVAAFLASHRDFARSAIAPHMPSEAACGLCRSESSDMFELLPSKSGADGFFISRMKRA